MSGGAGRKMLDKLRTLCAASATVKFTHQTKEQHHTNNSTNMNQQCIGTDITHKVLSVMCACVFLLPIVCFSGQALCVFVSEDVVARVKANG